MPGVVQPVQQQGLGQCRDLGTVFQCRLHVLAVLVEDRGGLRHQVVLRQRRVGGAFALDIAHDLALVLLEQADGVVLRVTLEEDHAKAVRRRTQVDAGLVALHQHTKPVAFELFARDIVVARVRHVEAGVHAGDQRVPAVHHAVPEHAPQLFAHVPPMFAVAGLQNGVGRQTGAQRRGDVLPRPVHDVGQRLPEGFQRQIRLGHVGAGDDQCVEAFLLQVLEVLVVLLDVIASLRPALELRQGERMDIELRDLVALADQAEELALGGRECRVGHHVQEPDVQRADLLLLREVAGQYGLALAPQAGKGGQVGVGDEWHYRRASRSRAMQTRSSKSAAVRTRASSVVLMV